MNNKMNMSRRTFVGGALAASSIPFLGGCEREKHLAADRVGVCSWSFRLPFDAVADEMKKLGLKRIHLAIQPFLEGESRHGLAESPEALDRVRARIASGEWKLSATMIGFPQEDYSTLESIKRTGGVVPDDAWERNKEIVKAAVKFSAELKSPLLTLHAGFLDDTDSAALKKYAERVKFIIDTCGEAGMPVAFETGQETADSLAGFLSSLPGAGINFDPANMILYGKGDPVAAVKKLAPWIRHVHVKDAIKTAVPGTWGTEVPWGEGEVGQDAFLDALEKGGYKGAFAIEREGGDNRVADIALAANRLVGSAA